MAKDEKKAAEKAAKDEKKAYDFEVGDPKELVPVKRPLVITPKGKEWANEAQAEFAKVLNGYAYKNQAKWETKKDGLLKQLARLADHPEEIKRLNGYREVARVEYKDTAVKNVGE